MDRHRLRHLGRAHHLQSQRRAAPNGFDARYGLQRSDLDRIYLVGDDARAGRYIFTGTPSGVGKLEDGNNVVVEIEGLGTLKNLVKAEKR